jgi:predicted lipoprotein with Yx(FWY)xxD motif/plastocyanin
MRRNCIKIGIILVILLSLVAVGTTACSSSSTTATSSTTTSSTTTTTTTPQYTINVSTSPTLGQYLVDAAGMTLYWTTADAPGVSNVSGNTLTIWPVFYTATITVPPSLNAGDFGSITRADGKMQTTYKDWPLYYYYEDTAAGQTGGQGIAGRWSVVAPSATGPQPVETSTTTTSTTTTSTTTTSTTQTSTTTTTTTSPTTTTTTTTSGNSVTIDLIAKNIAFDKSTITVPAGAQVTVNFDNQDSGIPHNFSVYTDSSATTSIFLGQIITGVAQITYNFTAPTTPGTYFFRCDVHPTIMTGSFIVQ